MFRLKEEKEEALVDQRRFEENLVFQENINKQLQIKEIENKNTIKQLTQQLGINN